jgi:hypothetical protein
MCRGLGTEPLYFSLHFNATKIDCVLSSALMASQCHKISEELMPKDRSGVCHCSKIVRAPLGKDIVVGEHDELILIVRL